MCDNDLSIYMKGYYEEFHALRRRENKANQSRLLYIGAREAGTRSLGFSGGAYT